MKPAELRAEQSRLLTLANELARRHWGVEYTGGLRLTNRKWTTRAAAFAYRVDGSMHEIRMSAPVNAELSPDEISANMLHELVHWRLWSLGLPNDDADPEFVAECVRVGAPLSETNRAQRAYERYLDTAV